jgi:hypothetical protein
MRKKPASSHGDEVPVAGTSVPMPLARDTVARPMSGSDPTTDAAVIAATRLWIDRAVLGLNLCPFARAPIAQGRVRLVVSEARDVEALVADLCEEAGVLSSADPAETETSLLIHPFVLADFLDFNDFLDVADATLVAMDLEGVLQIASFHPHYRFADTDADAIENCTNRSPYPTLHLLRESSIDAAVAAMPDTDAISDRNIQTLRALGAAGWSALQRGGEAET